MTLQIRNIRTEEWEDAMALVWRTFLKYEACDYEEEGVRSFLDFITDERLKKLHMIGEYHGSFLRSEDGWRGIHAEHQSHFAFVCGQ